MVISNIFAGQKDHLIVKGIAKGLEIAEDYIKEEELDEEVDLDENPNFETIREGENYTVYRPKSADNDNGGENIMGEFSTPEALEELSDETDSSQEEMYNALETLQSTVEQELAGVEQDVEVTMEEVEDVFEYLHETAGAMMNTQKHDYETVTEYAEEVLGPAVEEYADELRDQLELGVSESDYTGVRRNSEAMDARRNRFRENMGLDN